ncbi:MAG TPA: exodeoxyribonuclease V subunit beta [Candidatus Accumulibacter phosphatis]|nr:exodeoxyribonuclease V subunit beta [Candidatus Accumulibacter phosphatis]HRQ97179.1 exodeoxyribonuclease V subunit beta [Candidatus Accumulibacter phosphatis]
MSGLAGDGESTLPRQVLDPLRLPFSGMRLIEASAGTGKTFTIAALYLRLVLGHGGGDGGLRPLTPAEILVVSFTEAATEELRDRIRRRLATAAAGFRVDPETAAEDGSDELLQALRAEYPPAQWSGCARKLQLAAEAMDDAAVSTIHGWCNRMLRQHAFASNSLFVQTLEGDQQELFAEAVRDYWRTFMVPLAAAAACEVRQWWSGPEALQQVVARLVADVSLLAVQPPPQTTIGRARAARQQRLAELKAPWRTWLAELQGLLDDAVSRRLVDGRRLQERYYRPWLQALRLWHEDAEMLQPDLKTGWTRLTPAGLGAVWKSGTPPEHPALLAIAELAGELAALPQAHDEVLAHAARWVAERFAGEQEQRAQMGFNELLTRLAAALQGANGERLAAAIRRQFPVALIDEFQDTDPVQYRIFDAVYRLLPDAAPTALILIGDPKQAIYAFRGADIHTYLAARRACSGGIYTLLTNFRASRAMVAATNHCFAVAEQRRDGNGAFLFRSAAGNPLPFEAARAQGREDQLQVDGACLPALVACHAAAAADGRSLSKAAYLEQMAAACADEIVRLLNLGQAGRAGFVAGGGLRALRPADLAVLVNGRNEADAIRRALLQRGLRSVYLSDRDSVFDSDEAAELQHWLAAVAEPDDPYLLRSALATATLALGWHELDALQHDEAAWEARVVQFRGYRECWLRQGVLPMLRRLLHDFAVPGRLLGRAGDAATGAQPPAGGERTLTNLLHLAELLQQASALLDGAHALIRHLAEQRRQPAAAAAGDARQVRLESDAELLQVVTVHKAKGLEYPLVFLPFACNYRAIDARSRPPLKWHDAEGHLQLSLTNDPAVVERADRERLAEDLRKLYVALTRACHATWLGVAPLADLQRSALGYLLGGGQELAPDELPQRLQALAAGCPHISVVAAAATGSERFRTQQLRSSVGSARQSARVLREHWWIASYSALRTVAAESIGVPSAAPETAGEDVFREARTTAEQLGSAVPRVAARAAGAALHDFPRGAEAGTFLHSLLETTATEGFARVAGERSLRHELVARCCRTRGREQWVGLLAAWLHGFLTRPWGLPAGQGAPATSFSLCELSAARPEMEFWLPVQAVEVLRIDQLVCRHTLAGAARPALQAGQLNGMLKGFIDLVFEHQGRYYVVDYKSNWLGPEDAAYTPAALREAILHARYELQYVLYLVALHRLLRARLPGYDYDRHVGGAVYVFLRGGNSASGGLHVERPPRQLIDELDALFAGRQAVLPR